MTNNKYWIFLERLRRSGVTNMYGAGPYIEQAFDVSPEKAREILVDWMQNYDPKDYEERSEERIG